MSYKAVTLDKIDRTSLFCDCEIWLSKCFLGNGSFSKAKDFTDYIVSLGITIKGTTD